MQSQKQGDAESGIPGGQHRRSQLLKPANIKALSYGLMNIVSASGIVFANKYVFANCHFKFTYALTWIHTLFTLVGMVVFARAGMFEVKKLPARKLIPLAAAYVAYIVLCNLSLNINTVGFYQVMKIAVAPTVIALEFVMFGRMPGTRVVASVMVVCFGIAIATVNDTQIVRNLVGIFVGLAATVMTALYQIWAGSKQKDLKASSMQLLHAYTPQAAIMLGILIPIFEPMGWKGHPPGTLLGYSYTWGSVAAIIISSALGLLVSLSTFLVIGATSSLTYNVVGHVKTIIILTGGCMFFGDQMPPKKLVGVAVAMVGIVWYTQLKLSQAVASSSSSQKASSTSSSSSQNGHAHQHAVSRAQRHGGPAGVDDYSASMNGGSQGPGGMVDDVGLIPGHRSAYMAVGLNARPMGRSTAVNVYPGANGIPNGSTGPGSVSNKR